MEGEVGAHLTACLFVLDDIALFVAEPDFGLVVVPFTQALGFEYVLKYGLAEDALHLVLAFEGAGQVLGLVAYGVGLLLEVADRLGELGLNG